MAAIRYILNSIIEFLVPENAYCKIESLWLKSRDMGTYRFHMAAILEIQYGGHTMYCGSASYKKSQAMAMGSTYNHIAVFVRNVQIIFKTGPKLPD